MIFALIPDYPANPCSLNVSISYPTG